MTCDDMLEQISAALDGELTAEEKAQLDRHLAQCDPCRALFDELSAIHGACAHLEVAPPPALRARILEQLPPQKRPAKVIAIHWRRWAAMAAAFVLVALAAWHLPETLDKPDTQQSISVPKPSPTQVAEPADLEDAEPPALASEEPLNVTGSVAPAASTDENAGIAPLTDIPETALSLATGGEVEGVRFGGPTSGSNTATAKTAQAPLSTEDGSAAKQDTKAADATADSDQEAAPLPLSAARSMMSKEAKEYGMSESADMDASPQNRLIDNALPSLGGSADQDSDTLPLQGVKTALDEMPEPHPEMSDEVLAATLFKTECWLPPREYCGVLTFEGSAALIDYQPELVGDDGTACYTLPRAAFDALLRELESSGIPFELRTTGEDISAAAEIGCVSIRAPG